MNKSTQAKLTIKRSASLSYELGKQSTKAFAKQIGCFKLMRSSDIELFGLPGRTSACVPVKIHRNLFSYGLCVCVCVNIICIKPNVMIIKMFELSI